MWDQLESTKAQSLSTRKFKSGAGLEQVTGKSLNLDSAVEVGTLNSL